MRIGMDISLSVCREEGYFMAEFKKRELYKGGIFRKDHYIRFFCHMPRYILDDMQSKGWIPTVGAKTIITDVYLSAEEIWEMYLEVKDGIDSMIGEEHTFPQNEHDCLRIVSDLSAYGALD
jgi:hypothetical protein